MTIDIGVVTPSVGESASMRLRATREPRASQPSAVARHAVTPDPSPISELYDGIQAVIDAQEKGEVAASRKTMAAYLELLRDIKDVTALSSECTSEGSDGNHIKVDAKKIRDALEALKRKWGSRVAFGPAPIELVERLAEKWHLPCERRPDGSGVICVDSAPIDAMLTATPEGGEWVIGKYNAWTTAMTEQRLQVENKSTLITEMARNALATLNNMVKVLSSLIQTIYDSGKPFASL